MSLSNHDHNLLICAIRAVGCSGRWPCRGRSRNNDFGGSVSTLVYLASDTPLKWMWGTFDLATRAPPDMLSAYHQSSTTAGREGIQGSTGVFFQLDTVLHGLSGLLVGWRAHEVRRNDDKQKALCIMHMIRIVIYKFLT